MDLTGLTLSHYKILGKLGEGGMGVVYKAEDTRLQRTVALKFLHPELLKDAERTSRFVQEARAASSINHPHIATMYDIDDTTGTTFIAMEYIEGRTLREKLKREGLSLKETLDLTIQVSEALARAHERGIVHRDIKPDNIMVSRDGYAKILDFGLAKLQEPLVPAGDLSALQTVERPPTREGIVLGTVSYMSPEQARGQAVDHRSDIFSLGVVLYEMVTGELPFKGESNVEVLNAILHQPLRSLTEVRPEIPVELQWVVEKATAKDPEERYQTIKDVSVDLKKLKRDTETGKILTAPVSPPAARGTFLRKKAALLGLVVLLAMVLVWTLVRRAREPAVPLAPSRSSIAVMYFENLSQDNSLDWINKGLVEMLTVNLSQAPSLEVVGTQRLFNTLRSMGKADLAAIDKSTAMEVAQRAGVSTMLVGSVVKAGERIRLQAQLYDVAKDELMASVKEEGSGQDELFRMADGLAAQVTSYLNLPGSKGKGISFRITDVITRSPEAFRYYAEGIDLAFRYLHEEGIDRLRRAVQIDPTFAMAHLSLHMALRYFGLTEESLQALQKAVEHSRNLPEKEKLYVDAEEAYFIRQDPQEAVRIFEQITARYPNEWFPYFRMGSIVTREFGDDGRAIELYQKASQRNPDAPEIMNNLGYAYSRMGDYPMAIQFIEKYVALLPTDPNPQDSLGEVVFHSGDLDRAVREYRRVFEKNPQFYVSHRNVAYVHAVKGEYDAALSELSLAMSQSKGTPFEITCLVLRGVLAFYLGQYSKAESDFRHGLELAEKLKSYENGVFCAGMLGEMEFARARWKQGLEWNARASALAGRSPSVSRARLWQLWDSYAGGRAEVAQNHLKEAKAHLQAAEQSPEKPSGPQAQLGGVLIGTLRGEVLLLGGDAQRALEELRDARPPARRINLFNLPSAYVMHNLPFPQDGVARAYLALGRLEDAAQAYEDLLRFDSSDIRFLIPYPPYHAELGKVYERQGKRAEARAAYQRFLDLWKDADADQALPREVSARLKALS